MDYFIGNELVSENTMNNKRIPELLTELSQRKICGIIILRGLSWTKKLRCCEGLHMRDRLIVFQSVMRKCFQLRDLLTSMPDLVFGMLIENTFKAIIVIIATYHIPLHCRLVNVTFRRQYEEVCLYMLRCVYLPYIKECNFREIRSEFIQQLLSKSLQRNPDITRLILSPQSSLEVTENVVSNLNRLRLLQEFKFEFRCSNDIVIELVKHCTLLKILNVQSSVLVTNHCFKYLINLKNLEKLYVGGTAISDICYAMVLSNLPRIENFSWRGCVESVLKHSKKDCFPSVREFNGKVKDASLLAQKCPRIKQLSINLDTVNLSDLALLTDVVTLELEHCDFNIHNVTILLESMGTRLTKLDFFGVENIDFRQIVRCCSVLRILSFRYCRVVLSRFLFFNRELPHFKSVKEITLNSNPDFKYFHLYLNHYVNLENFHAQWVADLDDLTFANILNTGGFRKLSEIIIHDCGILTLRTAMLLIEKCDNLCVLGNLNGWPDMKLIDKTTLFDYVRRNNLALKVKLL